MADEMDGSAFVGQDSNAFGDGATDANSKPLSTRAENRLDANARYLQERGSQVTYNLFAPHGVDTGTVRPYASLDWASIMLVPWEVYPGSRRIRVRVKGEVDNPDSNTTGVVSARLVLYDGSRHLSTETTWTATGSVEAYDVVFDTSDENLQRRGGYLALEIASNNEANGGTQSTDFSAYTETAVEYSDGGTLDGDLDERAAIRATFQGDNFSEAGTFTVYHKSAASGGTHLSGIDQGRDAFGSAEAIFLSSLRPQTIAVEERFDDEATSFQYDPKSARSMQAQEPVLGQHVSGHGSNLDAIHERPLCKAIGPHGQDTDTSRASEGEGWPTDYRRKWSWINVTDESDTELDRQSVHLSFDGSTVRCTAFIVGFFQPVPDNQSELVSPFRIGRIDESDYVDLLASGDLELQASLEQMQSESATSWSDSTDIGSKTRTLSDHQFLLGQQTDFDLPNQFSWARHPSGVDSEASEFRFVHHEGQLWPDDYALFGSTPVTIDVPVSDSLNRAGEVRCNLDFSDLTNTNVSESGFSSSNHTFKFHLLCLGTSWWEVPSL